MRALSLTQPWAWIVLHGGKWIENRKWDTRFRGEFLIHASKGMTRDQYEDAIDTCIMLGAKSVATRVPPMDELSRGGIVGVANLYTVYPPCRPHERDELGRCRHGWHLEGQFGFGLKDVRPLPFLQCAGALGFWGDFELRDGQAVRL